MKIINNKLKNVSSDLEFIWSAPREILVVFHKGEPVQFYGLNDNSEDEVLRKANEFLQAKGFD